MTHQNQQEQIVWGRFWQAALVAVGGATIANVVVYFIASALGFLSPPVITPTGDALGLQQVIVTTIVGSLGGVAVFAALARFTRRPIFLFRIIALVVLLVSFVTPFGLPDASLSFFLTLEFMHIVTAVVVIWALTTIPRER